MKYIIANWKTYFSYQQSKEWLEHYASSLQDIMTNNRNSLIVCPSADALEYSKTRLKSPIYLGAQQCSPYLKGPHTGQILAESLKELSCSFCIIGHQEQRNECNNNDALIEQQFGHLIENNITPILCIGEKQPLNSLEQLECIIFQQLNFLNKKNYAAPFIIAYEPGWAIGSGVIMSKNILKNISLLIKKIVNTKNYKVIYGGSITSLTIKEYNQMNLFDGFLIGKASTDFQELKNIVLSL